VGHSSIEELDREPGDSFGAGGNSPAAHPARGAEAPVSVSRAKRPRIFSS
jgi:hypothetical protein